MRLKNHMQQLTSDRLIVLTKSLILLLLILFVSQTTFAAEATPVKHRLSSSLRNTQGTLVNMDTPAPGAQKVTVGIYGINVYNLDLKASTYSITAYMWLRWKGDVDPVASLDFTNLVQDASLTKKKLLDTPKVLSNGENYQIIRLDGVFFQPFNLSSYPLDKQALSLFVENSTETYEQCYYVPDGSSSGYDGGLKVPGWKVTGLDASSYIHDYGTDFGEKGIASASKYAGLKISLNLERYINFFIWKLMLPLLIILMSNWLSLLLNPTLFEVRVAMPATALLTIVFLQQSALDAIPGCSSLVLMDKIYLLAYLSVGLTLIQIIIINSKLDRESPASVLRMIKIDKISFALQVLFFVAVFAVLLFQK
ncbi:MAG: hypothetical protein HGB23_04375 [Chlorobiaceae bacterium]|nr:hypothetical protein [Chlorobiaceae bacterium]